MQPDVLSTATRGHLRRTQWAPPQEFVIVAVLGLLGLRIFETCAADIQDPGEEHGHRAGPNLDRHPNDILAASNLRVGEPLHRRLVTEAAEETLSLSRLTVRRLDKAS